MTNTIRIHLFVEYKKQNKQNENRLIGRENEWLVDKERGKIGEEH